MNPEEVCYALENQIFFAQLNQLRTLKTLENIPSNLWEKKLGLLFASRFDQYIDFKAEFIELSNTQLDNLSVLIQQSFDVDIVDMIKPLLLTSHQLTELQALALPPRIPVVINYVPSLAERFKKLLKRSLSFSI